ncbi:MAG: DMT family transporter [Chloroflexota bacterium]|nr:DMT family transporter [Chloroflexota bacterium]
MSMLAFAFILTAAGIHATWNLLAKRLDGGSESVWLFTLITTIVYAPPTLFIIMSTSFRPGFREGVILVGTGVLQAVYFVLLRRGYAAGDLSVVYPLARGIGPLAATMLAVALLAERPSFVTVTGALTVSLGTLLLVRRSQGATASRALLYGVTTGLVVGCYTFWDGYAVGELAIPAIIVGWAADAGRLVWLSPIAFRRRSAMRATWNTNRAPILLIGVLSSGSYLLVLYALTLAPVSTVAPAREISIVIGTLFGVFLLGEPEGRRRLIAAAVVTCGVMLVAHG